MGQFDEAVEDLRGFIKSENIDADVTVCKQQITLARRASKQTLEITYDDQEHSFGLIENLGNLPDGVQTQVQEPRRWSGNDRPISKSDMLAKARGWLKEQRPLNR